MDQAPSEGGTAVVLLSIMVPTRNRPTLVRQAIESVERQEFVDFELVVSDNSTPRDDALGKEIHSRGDPRYRYVAPQRDLDMGDHWEFATTHLQGEYVLTLGDRWLLFPGALASLAAQIKRHMPEVMSFGGSHLYSDEPPLALRRPRFSGRTEAFESADVAKVCSLCVFPAGLPTMVNSVVRRDVLSNMQRAYGSVFAGAVAPDVSFGTHMLDSIPRFHYFDQPLALNHGLLHSNGRLIDQGKNEGAAQDFLSRLDLRGGLVNAPVPAIRTNLNIRVHEYERTRSHQRSGQFVATDPHEYYLAMLFELRERGSPDPEADALLEEFRVRNGIGRPRAVRGGLRGFVRTPAMRRLLEPLLDAIHRALWVNLGNRPAGRFDSLDVLFEHEAAHPPEPNAARPMLLTPLQRAWLQKAAPALAARL